MVVVFFMSLATTSPVHERPCLWPILKYELLDASFFAETLPQHVVARAQKPSTCRTRLKPCTVLMPLTGWKH